jgi:large subunit ribosomal protein L25
MASKEFSIDAEIRDIFGKKVKYIRNNNGIPAIIYGGDDKPLSITIKKNEFLKLYRDVGQRHVVNIQIDKKKFPVIVYKYQKHPVYEDFIHVDFKRVKMNEKIHAEIPLIFTGESPAVKNLGAILFTQLHEVEVIALPNDIPENIEINLDKLENVDEAIHVSDIADIKNVEIITSKESGIVVAKAPRTAAEDEEEEVTSDEGEEKTEEETKEES